MVSPAPTGGPTKTILPSQAPEETQTPTAPRSSTVEAEDSSSRRATPITPTPTNTPTLPPSGIFAIRFYPPLVLDYDATQWRDDSLYQDSQMVNALNSREMKNCQISVQGPSGFYPAGMEKIQLGNIQYSRELSSFSEMMSGAYFAEQGLSAYDYSMGTPVLIVSSTPDEWQGCQTMAENLLATLRPGNFPP